MNYLKDISSIKVNKTGQVISLHKPLLLLLTISEIVHGKPNKFKYKEIEESLILLLQKYGLKSTKKMNPQYPFIYLESAQNIWKCSIKKSMLKNPDAASRAELIDAIGNFTEGFYEYVKDQESAKQLVWQLLKEYWTESYHEEILIDLGLDIFMSDYAINIKNQKRRGRLFVEEVLDAYERQCAICGQSIRLGDALLGIDACHVKPMQHNGADIVTNGVALCKVHHWALDRGAIGIGDDLKLIVSPKLNGSRSDHFFHEYSNTTLFIPRNSDFELKIENIHYHFQHIFLK
jgi:putative restriction endonuclease